MNQASTRLLALALLVSCSGRSGPNVYAPTTTTKNVSPQSEAQKVSAPPRAPVAPVALAEYFRIRRVPAFSRSGLPLVSFSHDGKTVAYASDEGGRIDIWAQPTAGGPAVQLSHVEGFVHSFAFSPKQDLLVFEADRGGDELPQLYATNASGKPARKLPIDLPDGRRTQFVAWAEDGGSFLFLANSRDEKSMDLISYDVKKETTKVVWRSSGSLSFGAVSRDQKTVAIIDTHSDANVDLFLQVVGDKAPRKLTEHQGDILFQPTHFSHDGKTLFATSDEHGEFAQLMAINLASGKRTAELSARWDVSGAFLSPKGHYSVTEVNENGLPKVEIKRDGKVNIPLPASPTKGAAFRVLNFSPDERFAGLTLVSDVAPPTTYVFELATGKALRLVNPLQEPLASRSLVSGESVEIPSFDGKTVPAFLFRPSSPGPHPALIDVHGGPTSQSTVQFSEWRQYLISKGYVVLVPNVRGSTGYGKTYTKLDNLDLGGGPLKDVIACKQYLVERASVDKDKVVVFGGSYGGYMALAAEAFAPNEFAANVDFFGVSDLKSLVESFPPYWHSFASIIYQKFGDPKNPAHAQYQRDRSPANFVDRMQRPLLVVQGDKDARVKKDQSDRIVDALKKRGVPVHYLVLENEGHGFTKTESHLRALDLTDRFLDRYLFGDMTVPLP